MLYGWNVCIPFLYILISIQLGRQMWSKVSIGYTADIPLVAKFRSLYEKKVDICNYA
jgi:hypothetical protein